jgi:opacity protein-like surface antigen
MKKFGILLSFFAFSFPVFSQTTTHQYVNVNFGGSHVFSTNSSQSPKVGFKTGFRYGYKFESGFRGELEVGYRQNHHATQVKLENQVLSKSYSSLKSWAYMFNLLYDVNQVAYQGLIPYAGFGLGYAHNTTNNKVKFVDKTSENKLHDDRFAYQALVGIKYLFSADVDVGLEYQYFCGKSHAKDHSFALVVGKNF